MLSNFMKKKKKKNFAVPGGTSSVTLGPLLLQIFDPHLVYDNM